MQVAAATTWQQLLWPSSSKTSVPDCAQLLPSLLPSYAETSHAGLYYVMLCHAVLTLPGPSPNSSTFASC